VAWAASLFADLISHWEKRNGETIRDLDPDLLDVDTLMGYINEYGDDPSWPESIGSGSTSPGPPGGPMRSTSSPARAL
jgi:hypothetical protein